jgi:hypothetical protein
MAKTVAYYLGQVFAKEVRYQELDKEQEIEAEAEYDYDQDFFDEFKENVDGDGNNLNIFSKNLFKTALIDGVTFILVDHVSVDIRQNPESGRLEYLDKKDNFWKPKSLDVDQKLNLKPYFIHVKANQILDIWVDSENGQSIIKHFRYKQFIEVPKDDDGLEREIVAQIIAWWPNKWEKWISKDGGSPYLAESGPNNLGVVPVVPLILGDRMESLTAMPPLRDLAEENRSLWQAYSDHDGRLMPFVRSPAFLGINLGNPANPDEIIPFGPSKLINAQSGASLQSVGVDPSSFSSSQTDIDGKKESMRDYGLQTLQANVTATASENSSVTGNASLKEWCANLQDSLENGLKLVAMYRGGTDGPAVIINTEFRRGFDSSVLSLAKNCTYPDGPFKPEYFASLWLAMAPNSSDWTVETIIHPDYGKDLEQGQMPPDDFTEDN